MEIDNGTQDDHQNIGLNLLGFDSKLMFSSVMSNSSYEVDTSGLAVFKNNNIKGICIWVIGASYKNEIKIW